MYVCVHALHVGMFIQINVYLAAYELSDKKQSLHLYLAKAHLK